MAWAYLFIAGLFEVVLTRGYAGLHVQAAVDSISTRCAACPDPS